MRLIDGDKLKEELATWATSTGPVLEKYGRAETEYIIDLMPTIEAVPLKPLAAWLAGYAAPPRDALRAVFTPGGFINRECLIDAWVRTLLEIDWGEIES